MENRTVTLTLPLDKTAKDFGYKIEIDPYDDVHHGSWTEDLIRNSNFYLPKDLEDADKLFPSAVGISLEDAERDAWASAMVHSNIFALESALEKIDLSGGGAEYQDLSGSMISAKAGVVSAKANLQDNTIVVEILNPEHLINTIINGVGYFAPDLSTTEPSTVEELMARIHHLNDYFDVYGESKPTGELPSNSSPNINDEYFHSLIKDRIDELSVEEVAEAVTSAHEHTEDSPQELLNKAVALSGKSKKELKVAILKQIQKKSDVWNHIK